MVWRDYNAAVSEAPRVTLMNRQKDDDDVKSSNDDAAIYYFTCDKTRQRRERTSEKLPVAFCDAMITVACNMTSCFCHKKSANQLFTTNFTFCLRNITTATNVDTRSFVIINVLVQEIILW